MWTMVYLAQEKEIAEKMRKIIEDGNIITKLRVLKKNEENDSYEILVPDTEMSEAHELILENEL